ncbi:unnamed protein product [Rotaria magnacalcarata]|uniref:Carbonic anhydrase n=1 Tax=Rotaria magnacalcarata TaxID=392030 RepID=A0A819JTG1_9BILA|nr:unnamed protein product [Rotaria magnacalcarata]CAF3788604.1 unnamed protein product [Rotaria magnacalcarata]CAF3789182.1 unnamed protein product [Rotaria magnacalcarata]CAF3932861.1 unnamed protein product [Rotaria magnacalcarata]CAF4036169.1 unnamed protein product [Rotaria magnacalcarata]
MLVVCFVISDRYRPPEELLLTCVDNHVISSRLTQAVPGNLVSPYEYYKDNSLVGGECAALELAYSKNNMPMIVVFGHSDYRQEDTIEGRLNQTKYLKYSSDCESLTFNGSRVNGLVPCSTIHRTIAVLSYTCLSAAITGSQKNRSVIGDVRASSI